MIGRQAKKARFIKYNIGFSECFLAIFFTMDPFTKKNIWWKKYKKMSKLLLYIMSRIKVTHAERDTFSKNTLSMNYTASCVLHFDPFTLNTLNLTLCRLQTHSCVLQYAFRGKRSTQHSGINRKKRIQATCWLCMFVKITLLLGNNSGLRTFSTSV